MPTVHKINFVSSILPECTYSGGNFSCIKIDQRKAQERELATFDENRRAVGMLNPMRDNNEGTPDVPGRRRDGSCDHGLSRRSLRVKPPIEY